MKNLSLRYTFLKNRRSCPRGKNLILGIAKGYAFKDLALFVGSLKQTDYDGDICLFVSDISTTDCNALRKYRIQTIPFSLNYPYIKKVENFAKKYSKDDFKHLGLQSLRYVIYYLYLAEQQSKYSNIMLADVRDVVFQKDPFDFEFEETSLSCFCENSKYSINSQEFNAHIVRRALGENVLREIGMNPIVCSGITLGPTQLIMSYLEKMIECMKGIKTVSLNSSDQAIHNYLIYSKQLKNVKLFNNEKGPVLHLRIVDAEEIRLDDKGFCINDNRDVFNVVHQYYQHPGLIKKFQEKYFIPYP
jgi:hypothetical protein